MYRLAVCEDEQEQREALCTLCGDVLTELGVEHTVTAFPSAEALSAALQAGAVFDLMCLDIILPGKSGMELAQELREYDERISIVFIIRCARYLSAGSNRLSGVNLYFKF